jgi:hypothetical protein
MPFVETFADFKKRQMNSPWVTTENCILFQNGARSDGHYVHKDPPVDDPVAMLNLDIEFLTVRLTQDEQAFGRLKAYCLTQSEFHAVGAGGPADPRALVELEKLQERILSLREEKKQKQAELLSLRGPAPVDYFNDRAKQQRAVASADMTRAMSINI